MDALQRSKNQRLINEALSLTNLEELCSMVMPVQPPAGWDAEKPWNKYLRDDVDTRASYSHILKQHLQSANSELREAGALHSVVSQLNWRGDNKFVHLQGASPMLPPDHLAGPVGQETLRNSIYDFSVRRPSLTDKVSTPSLPIPLCHSHSLEPRPPGSNFAGDRRRQDVEGARAGQVVRAVHGRARVRR